MDQHGSVVGSADLNSCLHLAGCQLGQGGLNHWYVIERGDLATYFPPLIRLAWACLHDGDKAAREEVCKTSWSSGLKLKATFASFFWPKQITSPAQTEGGGERDFTSYVRGCKELWLFYSLPRSYNHRVGKGVTIMDSHFREEYMSCIHLFTHLTNNYWVQVSI